MGRIGKIARLSAECRQILNQKIRDGKPAKAILEYLNNDEDVMCTMRARFNGAPISESNLSEWRRGGYLEWLRNDEACELVTQLHEESEELGYAAESADISELLATRMTVELTRAAQALLAESGDAKERWARLKELLPHLAQLRRLDQRAGILAMKKQEWKWKCDEQARRKAFLEYIESEKLTEVIQKKKWEMDRAEAAKQNELD